jgi:phosphomannomutase
LSSTLKMKNNIIKFGTDGWRAKIAEDFNFDNLRIVTQALCDYLKENKLTGKGIAVGYDYRFQSETFAKVAAEVCSGAGIRTLLTKAAVTSPVLSSCVKENNLACGIMITASHNPPEWNGFKIKESFGGSAFPETTKAVEGNLKDKLEITPTTDKIEIFDPKPAYLKKIKSLVDLNKIKKQNIKIIIDPMHGSGAGYFKAFDLPIDEIRAKRDPLFGGINPEPIPINLDDSFSYVKEAGLEDPSALTACIVLDGDGDRLAAIDGSGRFINSHNVYTLLLYHLIVHRKMSGEIVKTFNISNLVDKLCAKYKRKLTVTPIGFKYIADKMLKEDILLGGEESGGMGIKGYTPERDGILAGLMLLELIAYEKKSLAQILDTIMEEHGFYYYDRTDLQTDKAKTIVENLKSSTPKEFAGKIVEKVETLDGVKLNLKGGSWILFRASGTEPLLRIYVEATSEDEVKQILGTGENLINS